MPHHADRPTKLCACCGRPFQWRRRWQNVWEEVRYCSERCRNQARRPAERQRRRSLPEPPQQDQPRQPPQAQN